MSCILGSFILGSYILNSRVTSVDGKNEDIACASNCYLLDVLAALHAQILAFLLPFVRCQQPMEPASHKPTPLC